MRVIFFSDAWGTGQETCPTLPIWKPHFGLRVLVQMLSRTRGRIRDSGFV